MVSFEEGLSRLFGQSDGSDLLTLMSLAQAAGMADRLEGWLRSGTDGVRRTRFWTGPFANQSIKDILSTWHVLCKGDATEIRDAFGAVSLDDLDALAGDLTRPLAILDRGNVVVALHEEPFKKGKNGNAQWVALTLAESGDWDCVITILEQAHRNGENPSFSISTQSLIWKHAYLQRQVGTVLPKLAAIPFNRDLSHAKGLRAWQLLAYQIRAGRSDVCAPIIEPEKQTHGYADAAVMQIAELADDPTESRTVRELHRVLKIRPVRVDIPGRGLSFDIRNASHELLKAEIKITARRRDYAKAAVLAQSPSHEPYVFSSDLMIDAFIDEGDWRSAAAIAQRHDPRDRPPPEGFDDDRLTEYRLLQGVLATAAARDGDHTAARTFLINYARARAAEISEQAALQEASEPDVTKGDASDTGVSEADADPDEVCPLRATVLAGAAEGLLGPRLLPVLLDTFRRSS
jgi:hypothetical protein